MIRKLCWVLSLGVVVCGLSGSAFAAFGTPSWWEDVQFGGSGIVNGSSKMVYDQFNVGSGTVRLALMAHGRYAYSQTVDIDTQTYYVETGKYGGTGTDKDYAKWNFGFYVAAGSVSQLLGVRLSYDFDPGKDSSPLNWAWFIANFSSIDDDDDPDTVKGEVENSWNLAMNFLSSPQSSQDPPGGVLIWQKTEDDKYLAFDPNVPGEYTFKLEVFDATFTTRYGGIEMRVNAVPEPATLVGLASLGATGLGAVVLRRRKKA